jgi:putative transcriptional regulator
MSGKKLIESMTQAIQIGEGTINGRSYNIHIPETIDIKGIRLKMNLSQSAFAARFGLSLYSLQNWEQGRRKPDATARAYLKVIEKNPDFVLNALAV